MKRLLAALLALSMMFYVAPLNALATSDDNFSQTITVNSQPDADLVQAIASDPFLTQTNSAQEQKQTATVDTSDVSMEATNSFGKLLLAGMEEENSSNFSSNNRVTDIKLNGKTATVKYLVEEDADLVVGIYADDAEEQMVASGTVAVTATNDGTATVAITGDLPEYYVIKGYLFDETEHAPLCDPFTDTFQTKDMVDIANATVSDFPEDRVINLDTDDKTNFAVVKQDVTLLTPEDAAGKNTIAQQDNDNLDYKINNASDEIKNLQPGDILTYEYAPGEMLIVRVDTIDVSGDSVSIHGDDTLEITDVFDTLKIEADASTPKFEFEEMDGFTDQGSVVLEDSLFEKDSGLPDMEEDQQEENGFDLSKPFEDTKDADIGRSWDVKKTFDTGVTVLGSIAISAQAQLSYYISFGKQTMDFSITPKAVAEVKISGSLDKRFDLPAFGVAPVPGVYIGCEPEFILSASVNAAVTMTATAKIGMAFNSTQPKNGKFTNTSEAPTFKLAANVRGEIYAGIDFGPKVNILGGAVTTARMRVEIGAKAVVTLRAEVDSGGSTSHGCKICYSGTLTAYINLGISLEFLFDMIDVVSYDFPELSNELGRFYWSPEYKDFGWGDCPHTTPAKPDTPDEPVPDFPTGGTEIASGNCGGEGDGLNLKWTLDDKGVLTITGTGRMPDNWWYRDSAPWNQYADKIKYVWIKNGVTSIGLNAFISCGNLVSAMISDSVTKIGKNAFNDCINLTSITIPNSVMYIDDGAFYGCQGLREVTIPGSVISIGGKAFYGCNGLRTVTILEGVSSIGDSMFSNCTNLRKVEIPESVTSIGWGAFENCTSLTNVVIPKGVQNIGSKAFSNCISAISVTLPEGLINIDTGAFEGCTSLRKIAIPGSVTNVGGNAFYNCSGLTSVIISDGVLSLGESAFKNCSNLTKIEIPGSVTSVGSTAFENCSNLKKMTVLDGVLNIQNGAFRKCSNLTDVSLPESIISMGGEIFKGCSSLTTITIPGNVASVSSGIFADCNNLKNVTIVDGSTSIGEYAFANCKALTSITIPESVTSIGNGAFDGCVNLKSIDLSANVANIGDRAFYNCQGLTNISIPSGVTSIGEATFYGCKGLTKVIIPDAITSIGDNAFNQCRGLVTIEIPNSVTSIGSGAFYDCNSLKEITIPESVTSVGRGAFRGCSNITSIVIPNGVTSIETETFYGCTGLTTVTLPQKLAYVDYWAFLNCASLENVIFDGTKEQWKNVEFGMQYATAPLLALTIHCSDGDTKWNGSKWVDADNDENSITTGNTSESNNKMHAVFNGLTAGESYAVIVSKSSENPFEAGNLIYVNQKAADENGVLDVPFVSSDAEAATYVIASCHEPEKAKHTITIKIGDDVVKTIKDVAEGATAEIEAKAMLDDGREFQKWNVDAGGVELADVTSAKTTFIMGSEDVVIHAVYKSNSSSGGETKPEQPDTPSSSSSASSSSSSAPSSTPSSSSSASSSSSSAPSSTPSSSSSASSSSSSAPSSTPSSSSSASSSSSSASSSTPNTPAPSNNDDGGGAIMAVILLGGAAAAVTAGVVLMMPVEVSGVAQLSDGSVLANATVQVMKDGEQVAQTTTDGNGHFALEVKRGDYQMNVITTDPATGEQVVRTTSIKAPAKDTNIVF